MFCPSCGQKLPEGAKFCKRCGGKIIAPPRVHSEPKGDFTAPPTPAVKPAPLVAEPVPPKPVVVPPPPAQPILKPPSPTVSAAGEELVSKLEKERAQFSAERGIFLEQIASLKKEKETQQDELAQYKRVIESERAKRAEEQAKAEQEKATLKKAGEEILKLKTELQKEQEHYKSLLAEEQAKLETQRKRVEAERQEFVQDRARMRAEMESERAKVRAETEQLKKGLEDARKELEQQRHKLKEDTGFAQQSIAREKADLEEVRRSLRKGRPKSSLSGVWAVVGGIVGFALGFGVLSLARPKTIPFTGGYLSVESVPEEASVTLEASSRKIGQTPLNKVFLPAGEYSLMIEKPGFEPQAQKIIIEKNKESSLRNLTLSSLSPGPSPAKESTYTAVQETTGTVSLTSRPRGATVTNVESGARLGSTPLQRVSLPVGQHKLLITKTGYQSTTVEATVTPGTDIDLGAITLSRSEVSKPQQSPQGPSTPTNNQASKKGTLKVKIGAQWGSIVIDGGAKYQSDGPVWVSEMSAGKHTVRISPRGEGGKDFPVIIKAGETTIVGP